MNESDKNSSPADNDPSWNNLSRVLFVFGLAMGGLAAYLYWGYGEQLREQSAELDEKNREIALENDRLKEHVGYLTHSALESALADDTNAWLLGPDGEWTRVEQSDRPHSHHATMMRRAAKRTRRKIREQRSV